MATTMYMVGAWIDPQTGNPDEVLLQKPRFVASLDEAVAEYEKIRKRYVSLRDRHVPDGYIVGVTPGREPDLILGVLPYFWDGKMYGLE